MSETTTAAVVDLDDFAPIDTDTLEVLSRAGQPLGWIITLAGPAHPKTLAYANESGRKALRRQQQIEAQQANGRKVKADDRSFDEVARENVAWAVARIVDWTPIQVGGETIHFSEAAATKLLANQKYGFVLTQLVDKLLDERSFTKASTPA